jgi:hypothetical protein
MTTDHVEVLNAVLVDAIKYLLGNCILHDILIA